MRKILMLIHMSVICFERAVPQCWYNNAKLILLLVIYYSSAICMMPFEWTGLLTD